MEVEEIVEEMVEPGATHALDVGVLVAPGKGLLTDDGVDLAQLWHIRIVHVLAVLTKIIFVNIIFKKKIGNASKYC